MKEHFINLDLETDNRYDFAKFVAKENDSLDLFSSKFLREVNNLPVSGEFVISVEENRPDLLSYKIYNSTQYWWILLEYNSLISYADLVTGLKIKYPSIASLESLYFSLKALQIASEQ